MGKRGFNADEDIVAAARMVSHSAIPAQISWWQLSSGSCPNLEVRHGRLKKSDLSMRTFQKGGVTNGGVSQKARRF